MKRKRDYSARWGLLWRSKNLLDGERSHIIGGDDCMPKLFHTRRAAREYAEQRYGYMKARPDLRAEPHGWRFPRPVRVLVVLA